MHIVDSPDKVQDVASKMLGNNLITKQSGPDGFPCNAVYMVEKLGIRSEFYLSLTLDRAAGCPTFIYSAAGGMNIEDVAEKTPELVFKLPVREKTVDHGEMVKAAERLGVATEVDQVSNMFQRILDTFYASDCDMVEINPLVMTTDDRIIAADSKITIDSNAFFRQKDLFAQEDTSANDPRETIANKWDLNYIHIGGKIGCLVNGAGLAMSTMDIIKLYGGEPANFLDVGGSAVGEALKQAMMLVHDDPEVEAIFVNIFGGILDTHILSQSILEAGKEIKFTKPIVLRMKGLNSDKSELLFKGREEELNMYYITDFDTAAQKVVSLV